jgi:hypothetical protein
MIIIANNITKYKTIDFFNQYRKWLDTLLDGKPCDHPGCLSHISHPCEVCGRIGGIRKIKITNE